MLKFIKNKKQLLNLVIIIFVILGVCFYVSYSTPEDFYYKYDGIKYQAGNSEISQPITFEINGLYKNNGLFNESSEFLGTIKIGNDVFDYTTTSLEFNNSDLAILGKSSYGSIQISRDFKTLTITLLDKNGSWNSDSGWLISAPCTSRKEAVNISNAIIHKSTKAYSIQ